MNERKVFLAAALLLISGAASAQSFSVECRAAVRAEFRGPACAKSEAPDQSDPCFLSITKGEGGGFLARAQECIDAGGTKKWLASKGKR